MVLFFAFILIFNLKIIKTSNTTLTHPIGLYTYFFNVTRIKKTITLSMEVQSRQVAFNRPSTNQRLRQMMPLSVCFGKVNGTKQNLSGCVYSFRCYLTQNPHSLDCNSIGTTNVTISSVLGHENKFKNKGGLKRLLPWSKGVKEIRGKNPI